LSFNCSHIHIINELQREKQRAAKYHKKTEKRELGEGDNRIRKIKKKNEIDPLSILTCGYNRSLSSFSNL